MIAKLLRTCWARPSGAVLIAVLCVACGGKKSIVPAGTAQPDKFLFDRGNAELMDKSWLRAREYFRQIVDNYPQSPLRPEAKLGVGDTYLGESSAESLVLAANEFREFITFYPTNSRADYAQYKLAMSHEEAVRELQMHSGTQFDPDVVRAFLDLYAAEPPAVDPGVAAMAGMGLDGLLEVPPAPLGRRRRRRARRAAEQTTNEGDSAASAG